MTQFVEMDPASMKPVAITVHALQGLVTMATKRVVVLVRIDFVFSERPIQTGLGFIPNKTLSK